MSARDTEPLQIVQNPIYNANFSNNNNNSEVHTSQSMNYFAKGEDVWVSVRVSLGLVSY